METLGVRNFSPIQMVYLNVGTRAGFTHPISQVVAFVGRKRTFWIHSNPHSWMNRMRMRRGYGPGFEGERHNFNSTWNGNREAEIIPSSRRDSLVSLVCVFRFVRRIRIVGVRLNCRLCTREGSFIVSARLLSVWTFPSYLLINRNKLPPWYSHCGAVCRFIAFEEIAFPSATWLYFVSFCEWTTYEWKV